MGVCSRCVWPFITALVIVVAVFIYFFYPPFCTNTGAECPYIKDVSPPISSSPATTPAVPRVWESDFHLPSNIRPSFYSILVVPDLSTGVFSGAVTITLDISSPSDYLLVNIDGVRVSTTSLSRGSTKVRLRETFEYSPNQFWVVIPQESLQPGAYSLYMEYSGSLTKDIVGLYMTNYTDPTSGEERHIATTKFEPTYARRAFPCFDEPAFKAKFNVSIVRPSKGNYIALSNMNQVEEVPESPGPGLTTVKFDTSVPMSTYLACFIVCDFEHLPTIKTKRGLDVNVYARSGQIQKMDYAQKIAASTIDFYIDYFGIDYPLPKLDLIAIPDFVSGAMENWGLITFRETSVLYDPDFSSSGNQVQVALTTTHELAHMWFGDLVTMKWWDDLWLNEGFATFIEFKGTHHNHPEWDIDTYFLVHDLSDALSLDATLSSHPIIKHVSHPDQITEIFDRISYAKGASVIRMLEGFMGPENFRQGVVSYLKNFQYKNADTNDLWQHLQQFSNGVNVPHVMDSWTRQMGYPLLTVTRKGDTVTVTQQRYTADKNATFDPNESKFKYKWDVPVTIFTSSNNKPTLNWLLMDNPSLSINVRGVDWYKLNYHFVGFYRVNYPTEDWATLTKLLMDNITALDAADRANLIEDAFSLAESGRLDFSVALALTGFLAQETHIVVWDLASNHLLNIDAHLLYTPAYSDYRHYLRKLISPHINDSLWNFSPDATFLQRSQQVKMISLGCRAGVPACLDKVKQMFNTFLENGTKPHVEIRNVVYSFGMAESGEQQWDRMWDKYLAETDPQEKGRLRRSLATIKEPWILARLIERAKNEDYVRSQDYFGLMAAIAGNPVGNNLLWDWVRANWQYLVDRFTLNNRSFGRLLPYVAGSFSSDIKLKEVEQFIAQHPEAGAGEAGRRATLESIKLNIAWLEKHLAPLTEWLKTA
ncbi:aminopeptidase A-like isoform X1 [Macrosteles quadrilineatus]|uniref:aminopeptidase A-like isoform X1 n=1 Tax=Macrosteles quadrilineatus TaxID=74068 RepID=UPI0023E24AD1|nr:aminopeptidase A-like isoform X1 [Macrosteles quadrilineatus]